MNDDDLIPVRRGDLRVCLRDLPPWYHRHPEVIRLLDAVNAPVSPVVPLAHICEVCEEPTTRPYIHPEEGCVLCAPCVTEMPREGVVPLTRLREFVESGRQHHGSGSDFRDGIQYALTSLAALLDEYERKDTE